MGTKTAQQLAAIILEVDLFKRLKEENARLRKRQMTDEQIKHMVDRFLGWYLPQDFSPDAGIAYRRPSYPGSWQGPRGTNLLNSVQATEMVNFMLQGMPISFSIDSA